MYMSTTSIFWLGNSTLLQLYYFKFVLMLLYPNKYSVVVMWVLNLLLNFLSTQLNVSYNQVAYINYNMSTRGLPDIIYTFAFGPVVLRH